MNNVKLGSGVKIVGPSNVYGCELADGVFVGPFVEIQNEVFVGENTRISSHSFVCSGVTIGKGCFIAHGVMFTNDKFDSSHISGSYRRSSSQETHVGDHVRIGSNATIMPVAIGDNAIIGAGSVVTKDVPAGCTVCGNPAKVMKK